MRFSIFAAVLVVFVVATGASAEVMYTVTDLGPGYALALSPAGHVAGYTNALGYNQVVVAPPGGTFSSPGAIIDVREGGAFGVNSSGVAVGDYHDGSANTYGFRTQAGTPFTSPDGRILPEANLGTLGGSITYPNGINEAGQVVGSTTTPDGTYHAFRTAAGAVIGSESDLGQGFGEAINNIGQVTGYTPNGHAFRTTSSGLTTDSGADLGMLPGGTMSNGQAINDLGQVAGYSYFLDGDSQGLHAFRTLPGGYIDVASDLGALDSPHEYSIAYGINNAGDVVGQSASRAFLVKGDGPMLDLITLVDPGSGWYFSNATDINHLGQIVGYGFYQSAVHAFRLDPVPEPSSLLLFGLGALALLRKR